MKNRVISSIIVILLGLAIAFGPQTIFPVCEADLFSSHSENSDHSEQATHKEEAVSSAPSMKCYWTGRASLGIGILIEGVLTLETLETKV